MIFNKKKLIILSLAIILLVSSHTTQAFSFKSFFNTVFGRSNTENTQPASSAIPTKVEVSKPTPVTTEVIKTDSISPVVESEEVNPAEETVDSTIETEVVLKYGMTNSTNVSIVQEQLKKLGYFDGVVDGGYGKVTASAVASFQKENNIDGSEGTIVGAYTIKALGITLLPKDTPFKPLVVNVTVISPNGGEIYQAGQQITVRWTTTNIPTGMNALIILNDDIRAIGGDLVANTPNDGIEIVTLPTTWPAVWGTFFKVRVSFAPFGGYSADDLSDVSDHLFTITNQQPAGSEKILFMGGAGHNDVWSSSDIYNWNLISPNNPTSTTKWSPRNHFYSVYYDNKYWVVGSSGLIDLWSSPDGVNWTLVSNQIPGWESRSLVVFNNKMYHIGFNLLAPYYPTVWSTTDGVNWTEVATLPLLNRENLEPVVFNSKLYLIGGNTWSNGPVKSDVWSSADGVNWSLATNNGPSAYLGKAVSYNGKIYYFGGEDTYPGPGGGSSKVWSTPDGINWTLGIATPTSQLFSDSDDIIVVGGKLWLVSQYDGGLWYSINGLNWTKSCTVLPWDFRQGHAMVSNGGTPANTPDPCVQATPTITVISPNGGEIYQAGQQITATWNSTNIPSTEMVQVSLEGSFPGGGTYAVGNTVNSGVITFILPTQTLSGWTWPQMQYGLHYKLKVAQTQSSTGVFASDTSDNLFTINAPQTNNDPIVFMGGGNEVGGYNSFNDVYVNSIPGCLSTIGYSMTSGQPCNTPTTNWNQISPNTTASSKWSARRNFQTLYYDNRYWVIGGETPNGLAKDVWNSVDGVTWNQVATTTPFGTYNQYKSIVFNGRIYVIGGRASPSSTAFAKAWSTTDGINWTTTTLPFKDRENPTLGVMNNKLFVIGGVETVGAKSDTWSTTDGINWIQMNYFLTNISNGKILRFDDDDYFVGGTQWNSAGTGGSSTKAIRRYNVVSDSWDLVSNTFPSPSSGLTEIDAVVANGKIWVSDFSAQAPFSANKLWSSADGGNTWTQENANLPWSPRHAYKMITKSGPITPVASTKIFLMGGHNSLTSYNDVWSLNNSLSWSMSTNNAGWSPRSSAESVYFNGKIWILGGHSTGGQNLNDVWSSSDGINWTQVTANAPWSARLEHTSIVFNNKIWVIGGMDDNSGLLNDVWSSSDGINWTQVTANAPWSPRWFHTSVVFNNKMWVIGGGDSASPSGLANDVWSSSDGLNWTQVVAHAPWNARYGQGSVVFNNKMWVIGGAPIPGQPNDVWSSPDGITWTQMNSNLGWSSNYGHAVAVFNNKIFSFGGYDLSGNGPGLNHIWYSSDGVTWNQANAPWLQRALAFVTVTP